MERYDVAVIGGGIIGSCIASEFARKGVKVALLEKSADVANVGATKANSGIVHAGFDCKVGTIKAKVNVRGSELYPEMCERLGVEYDNCGALVVGKKEDYERIEYLKIQGEKNGVKGLSIIGREEILEYLPTAESSIAYALRAETSAVVSPYLLAIALAEEAVINGGEVYFNFKVSSLDKIDGGWIIGSNDKKICAATVINAAGADAESINKLAVAEEFSATFSRGEYMLLDLNQKGYAKSTIFPLPTKLGKGVLISPTAHGNIIVGPTAIACETDETEITKEGLEYIKANVALMADKMDYSTNIRVFAGVRTAVGDDFIIRKSEVVDDYIYLGGICSPGLSSAPAISEMVWEIFREMASEKNLNFQAGGLVKRESYVNTKSMNKDDLNSLIKTNPSFGRIVCRCESITEREILQAINSPLRPNTVDGIKRRVRAGMGRCGGGFCMPKVMELIARENKIAIEKVTKFGGESNILFEELSNGN